MTRTPRCLPCSLGVVLASFTILAATGMGQAKGPPVQYCSVNPATGIAYETTTSFDANKYADGIAEGGDSNTRGVQWIWKWPAPGPVYSVDGRVAAPGWVQIDYCTPDGTNAKCQGWVNSANRWVVVTIRWKEKCTHEQFVKELGPQ